MHEAELVLLELRRGPLGPGGRRPAAQARGLEDAVDVVPVEVRQEVADHEGEGIQREAGGATQRADHGPPLLARLPGALKGAAGAGPALPPPPVSPPADRPR